MSDEKSFLERWARRKREVANEDAKESAKEKARSEAPAPAQDAEPTQAVAEPAFDLSKLPSLESIVADSDITAFLQPGVPSALKHAALRRAWVADPAIRDFIGPADYAWDFTAPDSVPGFGALGPEDDVQKLVADVFRDATTKVEAPPAPAATESPEPEQPPAQIASAAEVAPVENPTDQSKILQREENIASQQDEKSSASVTPPLRRHGGAMPQ